MPEIRQVAIENYWPLIVKNTAEFGQIAVAENPEFNKLAECIYRILLDGFILDATEYGVVRWETKIGISPATGATLDERKAVILTYLSTKLPYTWRVLEEMLTALLGVGRFVLSYNNDMATLKIGVSSVAASAQKTIDELLSRVLPQPIVVEYYNLQN